MLQDGDCKPSGSELANVDASAIDSSACQSDLGEVKKKTKKAVLLNSSHDGKFQSICDVGARMRLLACEAEEEAARSMSSREFGIENEPNRLSIKSEDFFTLWWHCNPQKLFCCSKQMPNPSPTTLELRLRRIQTHCCNRPKQSESLLQSFFFFFQTWF